MAIHKVGNFKVEVLHEEHLAEKRVDVLAAVYEGKEFLDLARFDFRGFQQAGNYEKSCRQRYQGAWMAVPLSKDVHIAGWYPHYGIWYRNH